MGVPAPDWCAPSGQKRSLKGADWSEVVAVSNRSFVFAGRRTRPAAPDRTD